MKLAIVSDLHIGYERFEEDSYKQAREALEKASELADAILIPGDVFDKRAPKPEVIAQAINIFRDLSKKEWRAHVSDLKSDTENRMFTNVPIVAIPGTHERVAEGKDNVLKLLALAGFIVDASESTAMLELEGEKVAVFGIGGVPEERVKETIERLDPKPTASAFNIFMLHQSIYELLPFNTDVIRYDDLPKGFDLYINGHIHNRVEAVVHGKKFLIPGSTVITQLKEGEQEKKGFILFDTSDSSHKFIEINSHDFFFIRIKFDDATPKSVLEKSEVEISKITQRHIKNPIIKLCLEGTIAAGHTGTDMPLRLLSKKYASDMILEIDSSRLKSPETAKEIEDIREGLAGGMTIKELGMSTFSAKLKESKIEGVDWVRLFEILSTSTNKEKMLKETMDSLQNDVQ